MDHTYQRRRTPADQAGQSAAPTTSGVQRFSLPNSARRGADEGGMDREALRQAMREKMAARFGASYVNGQAEAEADRIGGQFAAASGPEELKERMGSALGADFSAVRFHTGAEASDMAAASQAEAFTSGRDIFLGGSFDAATAAHELVHTVQQGAVEAAAPVMSAPMGAVQYKLFPWSHDEEEDEEMRKDSEADNLYAQISWNQHKEERYNRRQAAYAAEQENTPPPVEGASGPGPANGILPDLPTPRENTPARQKEKDIENLSGDFGTGTGVSPWKLPANVEGVYQKWKTPPEARAANAASNSPPSTLGRIAGGAGLINNVAGGMGNMEDVRQYAGEGNGRETFRSMVRSLGNTAGAASDSAALMGYRAAPGLGIAASGIQTVGDISYALVSKEAKRNLASRAARSRENMQALMAMRPEDMTQEQKDMLAMYKAMGQGSEMIGINAFEGSMSAAANAFRTAGAAAGTATGPVGQGVGVAAELFAGGLDYVKADQVDAKKKEHFRNTVKSEIPLEEEASELVSGKLDRYMGPGGRKGEIEQDVAERVSLRRHNYQSMGEANNHITGQRAQALVRLAKAGNKEAQSTLADLGLSANGNGNYNVTGAARALGLSDYKPKAPRILRPTKPEWGGKREFMAQYTAKNREQLAAESEALSQEHAEQSDRFIQSMADQSDLFMRMMREGTAADADRKRAEEEERKRQGH